MGHTNRDKNTSEWVHDRLAELVDVPGWQPDPDLGLVHLRSYERIAKRRSRLRRAAVLLILITSVLTLAVPATRGIARQLLDRFYMTRPEAVRSMMPRSEPPLFIMEYTSPPSIGRFVSGVAEARNEAGWEPRLPPVLVEQVASGLAVLKVSGAVDAQIKIRVHDLEAALERRGIDGVHVPRNWDGVEIGYHLGPGIWVAFLGGTLGQSEPPALVISPGFPLIDFTEIALEAAGLTPLEAHNARHMLADSGGAFSVVPSDAKSNFRDISLKSGHGLLFENDTDQDERQKCSFCPGPYERVLTWAASERIFQLRSETMTVEQAIEFANSIN
jgi:hypothetical protein